MTDHSHDFDQIIDTVVKLHAEEMKIFPEINLFALIKGHIKAESDFVANQITPEPNVKDVSAGLMQLRIVTARGLTGITADQKNDQDFIKIILEPGFNIATGTKYIMWQLKRYKGDIKKAIGAYNAGSALYKADGVTFINQIYVDRVFKYYEQFKEEKKKK